MDILFVGHTYHLKTKSSLFCLDMLKRDNNIDEFYLDPGGYSDYAQLKKYSGKHYDALVVWQLTIDVNEVRKYVSWNRGVYFPMFDHFYNSGKLNNPSWKDYKDFTIINFCRTLHNALKNVGLNSHYIQYFPEIKNDVNFGDEHSLFFWQRVNYINTQSVSQLFKDYDLKNVHIHKALDPYNRYISPEQFGGEVAEFYKNINVTDSVWFEKKDDMYKELQKSSLYIAPRNLEGIGMSFLEAMSFGRCVLAINNPTMNEYIEHGKTGLLFDSACSVDFKNVNIRDIQENTYQYMKDGYEQWMKNKDNILDWIENK